MTQLIFLIMLLPNQLLINSLDNGYIRAFQVLTLSLIVLITICFVLSCREMQN